MITLTAAITGCAYPAADVHDLKRMLDSMLHRIETAEGNRTIGDVIDSLGQSGRQSNTDCPSAGRNASLASVST
ncbi:hypothetical protein [Bifidobacterium avesanii]|uniref:Uncharacterized protein n=1 Tax=Bifidobacterium avesanii TaxID=1798157 RepID=A0A7K3TEF5_9BIFI|nr:hypothetical protein [Bifidobacterium avesanii]KAB8295465.1 hypothetical protein DSM100685_0075 [Bifidobacterium avesanii]NEG77471.1 hypothetical protein [Bifidobacterium avesanii]